jgi:hypothetical protein
MLQRPHYRRFSKNGIELDGAPLPEIVLTPSAEIGIGGLTLIAESSRWVKLRKFLARLLGHCCASVLPSALPTASAPTRTVISRLNHTARMLAVYASQGGLPRHHARLASGCLARRCRAGGSSCSSRWVPYRRFLLRCFLLLQAFLAHQEFTVGGPTLVEPPERRG